jgi:diguanylate cyclase
MRFSTINRICLLSFLMALLWLLAAPAQATQRASLVLTSETKRLVINQIEYLSEPHPLNHLDASGPVHDSSWRPMSGKGFNFGNYHAPLWVRFDVINIDYAKSDWLFEVGQPLLDRVAVVIFNHTTGRWSFSQQAGNLVPIDQRAVRHHSLIFPIQLPPGERNTVYLRVESVQGLYLVADIWESQAFWLHDQQRSLLLGLFLGILAVMILYNLSLYIFTKDSNYLVYSAYVLAVVLYEIAATGIGGRYLWDQNLWIRNSAYVTLAAVSFMTATLFIRQFLSLRTYGGWLLQINNLFLVYWIGATLLCPFVTHKAFFDIMQLMALLAPVAGIATGVYLWIKGNVQAKYYTIAYLFLSAGTIILLLGYAGVLTRGLLTEYSQMVGFVLELVLLSLALADRINRERTAREEAQMMALDLSQKVSKAREEKLMVQEQILEIQRRANEELEVRVLERTNELERAMNNLEMANKELSRLSFTDPLTKVHNRRYFDEILLTEIRRAARIGQPLAVAVVDIDHFKQINDTHGHLIGDDCLRLVAKTMSQQLSRSGDLLARFGGEEFAIILPATTEDHAMIVADRVRGAVEGIHFIHRGQRLQLRVSIGVAGWIPQRGETTERLISAADKALYEAKRTGRNRAVAANA